MIKILYVWSDQPVEYNCSWHRCHNPAFALRRAGAAVELIHNDEWQQNTAHAVAVTEPADLIIFQRNVFANSLGCIIDWVSKGKRIVIDVDDAYHHMDESTGSPTWKLWRLGRFSRDGKEYTFTPTPLEQLEAGVSLCGKLSTPSRVLAADWGTLARTYVVPNYLDLNVYQRRTVLRKEPGKVYIGWAGSMGHARGFKDSGVIEALRQLGNEHKNIMFATLGENNLERQLKIAPARVLSLPWRPYALYPDFLAMLDIGLIPLAGEYDRRRSPLKSLEYTAMGLPWVGSDLEPNSEVGTGLLVQNSPEAWYGALSGYMATLLERKYEADLNKTRALGWDINNNVLHLLNTYEDMAA